MLCNDTVCNHYVMLHQVMQKDNYFMQILKDNGHAFVKLSEITVCAI
jgi:hypothetical protein